MWDIENNTPFGVKGAFARDRKGAETWLVAVKASYIIKPDGRLEIGEQTDPAAFAEYMGEPGKSSLKYESDLQLGKPGTDVILHGHAYAPKDAPVNKIGVLLKAGPIQKALEVTGDRFWDKSILGTKLSAPVLFEKIALTYENAFGGIDESKLRKGAPYSCTENPLGTGFARRKKNLRGIKAPNISYFKKGRQKPACFAPIPGSWLPRRKYGGTYDEKWMETKFPLLPDDFDDRFYYSAPQDQQVAGFLKGGEPVEIYRMSPFGTLKFNLPELDLAFKTVLGKKTKEHRAKLHTVIFEPDIPGFSMVFHTSLNCHNQEHKLEKTIVS